MKGIFICFTGIDGSGKTTLAKALVDKLEENNIKSKYVYNRYKPIITRPLMVIARILFLRGKNILANYAEHSEAKRRIFKNRIVSRAYHYLLLFDYFWQVLFQVRLPLMLGANIICDRYIYDTVITDIAIDLNYSTTKVKNILESRVYSSLFPKPSLIFLVDVPEEIAYQRKSDIPSIEYLKKRRGIYLDIGKKCDMVILDGTKSLEELYTDIERRVLG